MATKNNKPNPKREVVKSTAWLVEAAFRVFVGYELLAHFHNVFIIAAAIYGLLTAGIIVVVHFINAHN